MEDLTQGSCERLDRERLPAHRGRLEQRQPHQRAVEAGSVGGNDALSVDDEARGGPGAVPRGIADDLRP